MLYNILLDIFGRTRTCIDIKMDFHGIIHMP